MEIVIERCCGLDVHQASVTACLLLGDRTKPKKEFRTFPTVRAGLEELLGWLERHEVTHVTFEGTGVYWMPVHAVLEERFDITLVNARHVRQLPGRKTDVNDAQWLATLLRHGLLRKSFIPAKDIRALRDMTRYRRMLVQSATAEKNRILKLLEMAGIKLSSVVSDVFGKSGMAMLRAIAAGDVPLQQVVQMAQARMRKKMPELLLALDVVVSAHHRLMLSDQLARFDRTVEEIARYDSLLAQRAAPYEEHLALLCSIDGVQRIAAIEIFAEIGPDLSSFPTDGHFSSWAGTCPGQHESAGKHRNARRRRGNPYLQAILFECALAATRKKATYLTDKYRRLRARRGTMRALFAIAHKLTRAVYRVLTTRHPHQDLGDAYLDLRNRKVVARNLAVRLQRLGFDVNSVQSLFPSAAPP